MVPMVQVPALCQAAYMAREGEEKGTFWCHQAAQAGCYNTGIPPVLAEHCCKLHQDSWEQGEGFLKGSVTKTRHQSWPLVNLMEDAARHFYEGPTERTAECVHIVVLKKRRAMGIVLLPDLGLCFFFFFLFK